MLVRDSVERPRTTWCAGQGTGTVGQWGCIGLSGVVMHSLPVSLHPSDPSLSSDMPGALRSTSQ